MDKSNGLERFKRNTYSQNGEDGIVEELLRRIGVTSGWCCEFGAANGYRLSNTAALRDKGFKCLMLESQSGYEHDLRAYGFEYEIVAVAAEGPNSLDAILARHGWGELDVLSLDVEGGEYLIWEHLAARPKIVIIEINSRIPDDIEQIGESYVQGSSFLSTCNLAVRKGYRLAIHVGNLIFVREDFADRCSLTP